MRTTLTLDDDIVKAARSLAAAKSTSLGQAVSELARRGLFGGAPVAEEDGFPVFRVSPGARAVTMEDVKCAEDES